MTRAWPRPILRINYSELSWPGVLFTGARLRRTRINRPAPAGSKSEENEEAEMLGQKLDVLFTPEDQSNGIVAREIADAKATGRGAGAKKVGVSANNGDRFWAVGEF